MELSTSDIIVEGTDADGGLRVVSSRSGVEVKGQELKGGAPDVIEEESEDVAGGEGPGRAEGDWEQKELDQEWEVIPDTATKGQSDRSGVRGILDEPCLQPNG